MGSLDPREHNHSILRPFGVWAVLAPFNFPHALSAGMSSGAMVAGNTVVFKPASATALAGYEMARCYRRCRCSRRCLQFHHRLRASRVGEPLALHPDVDGSIFTGSKEVGLDLFKRSAPISPSRASPRWAARIRRS